MAHWMARSRDPMVWTSMCPYLQHVRTPNAFRSAGERKAGRQFAIGTMVEADGNLIGSRCVRCAHQRPRLLQWNTLPPAATTTIMGACIQFGSVRFQWRIRRCSASKSKQRGTRLEWEFAAPHPPIRRQRMAAMYHHHHSHHQK